MTLWVGMDYIKKVTGYKDPETIKRRILIPHREEIEKFAYYPKKRGEKWRFSKEHLDEWLKNNVR